MAMDGDTKRKLKELLKKIDNFINDLKPLRNKLSRSLGQQRRQKNQWK